MDTYQLKRKYFDDRTEGVIETPLGTLITTLERSWEGNKPNISCIPSGTYKVHRDQHGRHTWFRLHYVEGRTNIEIHEGYKVSHSAGCILLDLIELQNLLLETKGESFMLEVS